MQLPELIYLTDNYYIGLKNVNIQFKKQRKSFAYVLGNTIYVSEKDWKKMPKKARLGLLAHELSHIELDLKRNIFKRLLSYFKNTLEEREVDMHVIKKGCGKYLLAFIEYHDEHYEEYNQNDGLTKKEIKELIKNINP